MDSENIIIQMHKNAVAKRIPISVTIELNEFCNFNCLHCYVKEYEDCRQLPFEKIKRFAFELRKLGCLYIKLTGGEVFLNPDFIQIYTYLYKMGFVITILTNGSLIDEKIIQVLAKYKPKRVEITMYGSDEDTYYRVTGKRCFGKVVENILALKNDNINVLVKMFVLKENINSFEWVKNFASKEHLDFKADSLIISRIENQLHHQISIAQRLEILKQQKDILCDVNPELNSQIKEISKGNIFKCGVGRTTFWIMSSGKIRPCNFLFDVEFEAETQSLSLIWDKIKYYADSYNEADYVCASCDKQLVCDMCPAKASVLFGSIEDAECDEMHKVTGKYFASLENKDGE